MSFLQVLIYGIIQGLTEFLPVSSSGHLALLPKFMSSTDPGAVFDLFMHVGTALAVIIYFFEDVKNLLIGFINLITKKSDEHVFWFKNFVVANIATFVLVLLLKPLTDQFGRLPLTIGLNLIIFGAVLYASDKFSKVDSKYNFFSSSQIGASVCIGLSQAIAVFPGVSRSGVTISMGRLLSFSKEEAARFSFLLSLPIIFAGSAKSFYDISNTSNLSFDLISSLMGVGISLVVGLLTIHFFLKLIKKISFLMFFVYRLILGIAVIYYLA